MGGHTVITAVNGKQGVALARKKILTLSLRHHYARQNGYEVIEELKQDPRATKIIFIFATASTQKSEMSLGMELGAIAYLRKAFDGKEVLDTIKHWMAHK